MRFPFILNFIIKILLYLNNIEKTFLISIFYIRFLKSLFINLEIWRQYVLSPLVAKSCELFSDELMIEMVVKQWHYQV